MHRLLLNIGNTHIQTALDEPDGPRLLDVCDTGHALVLGHIPFLQQMPEAWTGAAVCVVPQLRTLLEKRYPSLRFLTTADFPQLDFSRVDSTTLGMDRVANASAALHIAGGAAMVIDFGTCIHTVVVRRDGVFLGGAIMPGRILQRKALATYTAQLPMLPLRDAPSPPVGPNTLDAMAAGVDLGIVGAVRELLDSTRRQLGGECLVLPTGGDAPFFLKALPGLRPAPELLTLRGVALAASVDVNG
ncbi:MAG: type III pantothenate kinase [Victivallales bacterium]|nr:type III pantothenate kinase [Victivallales bacterium]